MKLTRELQSVGINVFINEFEFFKNMKSTNDDIEYLIKKNISNRAGAIIRCYYAKKIFSNKSLLTKCLQYIAFESKRVDLSIRSKAKEYLQSLE